MSKKVKRKVVRAPAPTKRPDYKGKLRQFRIPSGLPTPDEIRKEIEHYRDVLHGRAEPPIQKGVMTLMEVAEGYFSRACEMEQMIYQGKAEGWLPKNMGYEQLRTQEIRSFKELAKAATDLGSRRITFENLRFQQENRGMESL